MLAVIETSTVVWMELAPKPSIIFGPQRTLEMDATTKLAPTSEPVQKVQPFASIISIAPIETQQTKI